MDFFARVESKQREQRLRSRHMKRNCFICRIFGSNLGKVEGPKTKLGDGGGRAGRCITGRLEKTEGRGQFRASPPGCVPDDRYGNNDQGGIFDDYRGGVYARNTRWSGATVG
eukprot:16428457-Heterocapsa_arctica.AAC.1